MKSYKITSLLFLIFVMPIYSSVKKETHILQDQAVLNLRLLANFDNVDKVITLLNQGAQINCQDSQHGNTILHLAARNHKYNVIDFLLEQPDIDRNIRNFSGLTAREIFSGSTPR